MSIGLKIYDKDGRTILDATSRPPKLLGVVENVTTMGGVEVIKPDDSYQIWFYVQATEYYAAGRAIPIVTISGNTISWRFMASAWIVPATTNIYYGVY